MLKPDRGSGDELEPRWFYSFTHNKCLSFRYKGTKGNANNFDTKENCEKICFRRKEHGNQRKFDKLLNDRSGFHVMSAFSYMYRKMSKM